MTRRPPIGLPLLLVLLAACDIPSAAPNWDMTWNVPGQSSSISVNTFLPAGVSANTANTAFQISVNPVNISQSLAQDCPACAVANGLTIPKPQFSATGAGSSPLPTTVTAATLVGDTLTLTINNGFNFDPLRPKAVVVNPATDYGFIVDTIKNGTTIVGHDSINGATSALPKSGGQLIRKIVLTGTITGASPVSVTVFISSPSGDAVTINTAQTIAFSASAGNVNVSSATVNLTTAGSPTTLNDTTPTEVNLAGVGSAVSGRVNNGFFILSITNPVGGVSGLLTAKFTGGPQSVTKTLALSAAATSTDTLMFTKADLQNLIGYDLALTFSGTINGTSVTVTPGQTLAVSSRLQINLQTVAQ